MILCYNHDLDYAHSQEVVGQCVSSSSQIIDPFVGAEGSVGHVEARHLIGVQSEIVITAKLTWIWRIADLG
ncbi:uncharacterized protein DS421_12g372210 [Arachis hypogaea]|nr:uncharacterized protein DS421_12g372210 [Arachis hypogaea]